MLMLYIDRVKQFEANQAHVIVVGSNGSDKYMESYLKMMGYMFPDIEEQYNKSQKEKMERANKQIDIFRNYKFTR